MKRSGVVVSIVMGLGLILTGRPSRSRIARRSSWSSSEVSPRGAGKGSLSRFGAVQGLEPLRWSLVIPPSPGGLGWVCGRDVGEGQQMVLGGVACWRKRRIGGAVPGSCGRDQSEPTSKENRPWWGHTLSLVVMTPVRSLPCSVTPRVPARRAISRVGNAASCRPSGCRMTSLMVKSTVLEWRARW
jgi:hypothetical protein